MQGLLRGFRQDLCKIFSQVTVHTLAKIFMPGPLGGSHKIVIKGPAAAGEDLASYKILI
jgi:hypothetical protein